MIIPLKERKIVVFLELALKIFENISHSAHKHERISLVVKDLQILEASTPPLNPLNFVEAFRQWKVFLVS